MATDPGFAASPRAASALLGAVETNLQVPTTAVDVLTAGAQGSLVTSIVVEATTTSLTPTTVAGLVYIILNDGTTNHLYDTIPVTAVTASATVSPYRARVVYTDLVIPSGWKLRASQSVSGNASILKVTALGGDF